MSHRPSLLALATSTALSVAPSVADASLFIGLQQDAGPIVTVVSDTSGFDVFSGSFGEFDALTVSGFGQPMTLSPLQLQSASTVINNAGAADSAPFERITDDLWRRMMAVNLDALLHCCQAALPDLRAAAAGRIVTIASTAGLRGYAYTVAYAAAKHGAIGLTRALAVELAGSAVTVNAVCPGFTDTDLTADATPRIRENTGRSEAEARADLARFNPQGRLVTPEEVASAVLWLCLPESASITGQAIAVAGGEVM